MKYFPPARGESITSPSRPEEKCRALVPQIWHCPLTPATSYPLLTKLSNTFFLPAFSKSMLSLLPSTLSTLP